AGIGGLSNGNTVQVSYTDGSSVQHNVTIVRVDDPSALPLSNAATANPNDTVIGVDFTGGAAAVATALNTALGATGLQFSNPSGAILEVINSGSPAITVNAVSTTATATSLTGGTAVLPLFVGGATRPNFIYNQLVNASLEYSPAAGIGGAASPFQGTLSAYMGQIVSTQSIAANAASNLQAGQDIVVNALQTRFNSTSAVSIDTEMAHLLTLQNAYGANARVMSTVKAMLDALLQM